MAITVSSVLASFAQHYPDCDSGTQQSIFETAHRELLDRSGLRHVEVSLDLVQGNREVDLDEASLRVLSATYYRSSRDFFALPATSSDELENRRPGWRGEITQAEPSGFYVESVSDGDGAKMVIGFDRLIPFTTSAGYPSVVLRCEQFASISGSDDLPAALLSEMWHVYRMCELWSARFDRGTTTYWHQMAEIEMQKQVEHSKDLAPAAPNLLAPPRTGFMPVV